LYHKTKTNDLKVMEKFKVTLLNSKDEEVLVTTVYASDYSDADKKAKVLVETARDKSVVSYRIL
jgi:hypothetical protein